MAEQKPATVEKSQPDKFRDLALELGCDEDEKAFQDKVKKVAKSPPEPLVSKPE